MFREDFGVGSFWFNYRKLHCFVIVFNHVEALQTKEIQLGWLVCTQSLWPHLQAPSRKKGKKEETYEKTGCHRSMSKLLLGGLGPWRKPEVSRFYHCQQGLLWNLAPPKIQPSFPTSLQASTSENSRTMPKPSSKNRAAVLIYRHWKDHRVRPNSNAEKVSTVNEKNFRGILLENSVGRLFHGGSIGRNKDSP